MTARQLRFPLALLPVVAVLLAGCGDSSSGDAAAGASSATKPAPAATVAATASPAAAAAASQAAAATAATAPRSSAATAQETAPGAPPIPGGGATPPVSRGAAGGPGFAAQRKTSAIQLGSRMTAVLERLGQPRKRLSDQDFDCFVYATDAGPDTWVRMCFRDGRMTGMGTISGRRIAMTLRVAAPKGDGKLVRPKPVKGATAVPTIEPGR
jgi:hypothetical protein